MSETGGTGDDRDLGDAWRTYALRRIQSAVDKSREEMTEAELDIYTFASNALALGDPVMRVFARGPGAWLCRVCLAEFREGGPQDHAAGCPMGGEHQVADDELPPLDPDL